MCRVSRSCGLVVVTELKVCREFGRRVRIRVLMKRFCKCARDDDNRTAVSGSYVTVECATYPQGGRPFLVAVVLGFSGLAL